MINSNRHTTKKRTSKGNKLGKHTSSKEFEVNEDKQTITMKNKQIKGD